MATYTIREVAQRFHVQTSTLRYYEDQGLLCNVERDDAGRRVYTDAHIGRLKAIACFKHAGMSIDELKRFFAYEKDERAHIADMLELLESRHHAILEQREAQYRNRRAVPGLGELRWQGFSRRRSVKISDD